MTEGRCGKMEAAVPDVAEGPNTETQEWNHPTTRCALDTMVEAMQLTEPVVGSQENTSPLVQLEEQRVNDATDMDGVEVRVGDVAAGRQVTITQTSYGQTQRPAEEEGLRKGGGVCESGGEGMESEYPPPEEAMLTTATPSSPKPTKKLRVDREESPPSRRRSRTKTRTTIASTQ
jgi:hypothetical protein